MIQESWCDSLISAVILEAINVIQNQLRTPQAPPDYGYFTARLLIGV